MGQMHELSSSTRRRISLNSHPHTHLNLETNSSGGVVSKRILVPKSMPATLKLSQRLWRKLGRQTLQKLLQQTMLLRR